MPLWRRPAVPWALAAGLALCVLGLGLRMATLQQRVDHLSAPKTGVELVDLYPESEATTRGETPPAERVRDNSVLILHLPDEAPPFEKYEVEVVAASGKDPVFSLPPDEELDGSLTFQLPASPLPAGSYTAHLYGLTGGRRELLDRYSFKTSPGAP